MTVHTGQHTLAEAVAASIRRHRAGDQDALGELFGLVRPLLHRIAVACRLSPHSADDVVQATMEAALVHLPRLRDPAAGLAWLSVIARREAIRVITDERRTDPLDDQLLDTMVDPADTEQLALARLSGEVVQRAVDKLRDRERELLRLLFLEDQSDYATVASVLDMPVGSIGPTRQRGLKKVRGLLLADREWDAAPADAA